MNKNANKNKNNKSIKILNREKVENIPKLSENKGFLINILESYKQEKVKVSSYLQNIIKSIRITKKLIEEVD